jgi:hypothetical protein
MTSRSKALVLHHIANPALIVSIGSKGVSVEDTASQTNSSIVAEPGKSVQFIFKDPATAAASNKAAVTIDASGKATASSVRTSQLRVTGHARVTKLEAAHAHVTKLEADGAHVTKMEAAHAHVTKLEADTITTSELVAAPGVRELIVKVGVAWYRFGRDSSLRLWGLALGNLNTDMWYVSPGPARGNNLVVINHKGAIQAEFPY